MNKTLYLDLFSGISGDMFLGALLDLGADFDRLKSGLAGLRVEGYHLHQGRQQRSNISGVKFDVRLESHSKHGPGHSHGRDEDHSRHHEHDHDHEHEHDHGHAHGHSHSHADEHERDHQHAHDHARTFKDIRDLIEGSDLSDWVRARSISIFERIARAEGKVHGLPVDAVHFHEVGAVDSIVDIVGACIALEMLGRPRVRASHVTEGTGYVDCAHGRFPVPTAATMEILGASGIPISQCEEPNELVTPTGAALLAEFVEQFGPMAGFVAEKIGYGLGTRENKTRPNVLRAALGEERGGAPSSDRYLRDEIVKLETNLDDLSPEILGYAAELALEQGALDVWHTPVYMKKNRPAFLLTILCESHDADRFIDLIFQETSTFGVRKTLTDRVKLDREIVHVTTPWGEIPFKKGRCGGETIRWTPEYEACKKVARENGVPLQSVIETAVRSFDADK